MGYTNARLIFFYISICRKRINGALCIGFANSLLISRGGGGMITINNQTILLLLYSKLSYGNIKNKKILRRYATINSFCKSSKIKKLITICILTSNSNINIRGD